MPVASENKDSLDILSLASDSALIVAKPSVDMDLGDQEKQQEPTAINLTDLAALVKHATECGLPAPTAVRSGNQPTIIIFDWDDTLLASTFLSSKGFRLDTDFNPTEEVEAGLRELEQSVIAALTLAKKHGDVHIVTNAETGWVQLSAAKWMPAVVSHLDERVTIVSARSTWEEKFPGSPFQWKFQTMQNAITTVHSRHTAELESKSPSKAVHVISLGDSHVEREAVRAVTRGLASTKTKSVKFAEHPSMEQLRRQLDLVTSCFQYIVDHNGDLDLMLTISLVY